MLRLWLLDEEFSPFLRPLSTHFIAFLPRIKPTLPLLIELLWSGTFPLFFFSLQSGCKSVKNIGMYNIGDKTIP